MFLGRGLLFRQHDRQCFGERLILPFGREDGRVGGIFGATDYKFAHLYPAGPEVCGEVEHWFDLAVSVGLPANRPSKGARYPKYETAEVS
jgi:hypothetical protein